MLYKGPFLFLQIQILQVIQVLVCPFFRLGPSGFLCLSRPGAFSGICVRFSCRFFRFFLPVRSSRLSGQQENDKDDRQDNAYGKQTGDHISADCVVLHQAVILSDHLLIDCPELLCLRILEESLEGHFLLVVAVEVLLPVCVLAVNDAVFWCPAILAVPDPAVYRMFSDVDGAFPESVGKLCPLWDIFRRQNDNGLFCHTDCHIWGKDIFLGIIYKEISVSIFIGHIKEDHALVIGSCLDCGSLILIFCYRKAFGKSFCIKGFSNGPVSILHVMRRALGGTGLRRRFRLFRRAVSASGNRDGIRFFRASILCGNRADHLIFAWLEIFSSLHRYVCFPVIGRSTDRDLFHIRRNGSRVLRHLC